MRWNVVAPFAVFVVALAGCAPKEDGPTILGGPKFTKLETEDTKVGTGPVVETGDDLWMRYKGTFKNGEEFDSNIGNDKPLFSMTVGGGGVIQGWDEGVVGMKEGGVRKLKVPSALAYGPSGSSSIPPNADLLFEIELVKVLKAADKGTVVIKTTKQGAGRACKDGDTVTIEFEGKTMEGELIDSSKKKGGKPATFKIGADALFARGLEDGIVGMKVGEERTIQLSPPLGMPVGLGAVKRATIQTFTVKLVKIQ